MFCLPLFTSSRFLLLKERKGEKRKTCHFFLIKLIGTGANGLLSAHPSTKLLLVVCTLPNKCLAGRRDLYLLPYSIVIKFLQLNSIESLVNNTLYIIWKIKYYLLLHRVRFNLKTLIFKIITIIKLNKYINIHILVLL